MIVSGISLFDRCNNNLWRSTELKLLVWVATIVLDWLFTKSQNVKRINKSSANNNINTAVVWMRTHKFTKWKHAHTHQAKTTYDRVNNKTSVYNMYNAYAHKSPSTVQNYVHTCTGLSICRTFDENTFLHTFGTFIEL